MIVLYDVRWETYTALMQDRGDGGPRMCYDRGTLEIMSPLRKHEWLKSLLGRFVEILTLESGIPISSAGSTTLRSQLKERGIEPDESYDIQNEPAIRLKDDFDIQIDPPPDLAIEIDITSSSIDKLGVYAAFGIRKCGPGMTASRSSSSGQGDGTPKRHKSRPTAADDPSPQPIPCSTQRAGRGRACAGVPRLGAEGSPGGSIELPFRPEPPTARDPRR